MNDRSPSPPATTFRIGGRRPVRRLGFGAMHLPTTPGPDRERGLAVARHAVRLGVNLIDTAHLYGWGENESLLAEALHPYPDDLLIATKVGVAPPSPGREADLDGRPEFLRAQVEEGLRRLRLERIELLQLHRVDPKVPLADQVGALAEARERGEIAHLGLSEVTVAQLAEAREITGIATVQNRYSVLDREYEDVVDACQAAGIGFLPWRPVHPATVAAGEVQAVAAELGATAAQVALAWLLRRSPVMLPIPGTGSVAHLEENVAAGELTLSDEQFDRLDGIARP
ncbi:aldo/keto reductase [Streptomyces sp. 3MP-14]|uniref:Aldo/keto reductase n=1 Tax=Streptomyces mimosae TaxID=2586635 RepID=A0A5N6ADD4_9ACTN|nr:MULTISPECIES: aldo/keto reductase [Streptomyces]KAB8165849.1 aldo/keto reductase [Streptomyces mimosae]KAB8176238.1 aldo/keto reductase [Streptomyces sp. 3MP-14]